MGRTGARRHPRAPPPSEDPNEQLTQELLELAFHRASKVATSGDSTLERSRRLASRKIGRASGNLLRQLRLARRPFLDLEALGPFRRALLGETMGPGGLERALKRVGRAEERLIRLRTEEERKIPRFEERDDLAQSVRRYYGRAASLIREVAPDLLALRAAQRLLRDRPALESGAPIVVVVGYPNVGKSSLVARLTRARPKVAPYPFTTVAVSVGHTPIGPAQHAQVVDTPGMLDRDQRESNAIEREAYLAVREGGPLVVFLLDPSGSCGWLLEEQERLLARLREAFPDRTFLEVENKADLIATPSARHRISCLTGQGIDELLHELQTALRPKRESLPPLPPIRDDAFPLEER